ncbi:stage V sporulation protein AB [Lachnoclostridium sp. An169]|uniref:stage V sporulation protein AB n=1 Tax=Lachnoclostridium sp. An169 TaxID=1965569 RepID=UPI000B386199|nr:stage V sporulation protein AB [Lachnoclostridium sp. An169]OUP82412.1 stage V sporulation protein AB [Lachnoclostridium sp. An169]HJA67071.1 stage V sporulation protein AB [Candidatus Mediterraneibacter cottocaccae]
MWEWAAQCLLAVIGISGGVAVAAGLFSFIVELGVVADFADRTHTGEHILLYEDCVALGGILGNLVYVFQIRIPLGDPLFAVYGIFAGIFTGCWAMALAEILNVYPVFMRRLKIVRYMTAFVISMALGKGLGAGLFFWRGW